MLQPDLLVKFPELKFKFKFKFKALPWAWEELAISSDCYNYQLCDFETCDHFFFHSKLIFTFAPNFLFLILWSKKKKEPTKAQSSADAQAPSLLSPLPLAGAPRIPQLYPHSMEGETEAWG